MEKMEITSRPIIALVGRPNVGKSTLFNRMVGRREAITSHIAGTTRDRHFGIMEWFGQSWTVVDTAGVVLDVEEEDLTHKELQRAMEEQVAVAVGEATIVGLVVDVKEGLHPVEKRLLSEIRKHNKTIVIFGNKADNAIFRDQAEMFREMGVDEIFPVSAIHGSGMGDFIDYLIKNFPAPADLEKRVVPRVTIIGRPNVGKSTLLNQIMGEERAVVSDVAGTTRDAIAELITLPSGKQLELIDTAGIRRRGQIELGIEKFSLFRTLKSINRSDAVILLLTIEENPTRGDAHIAMYAQEAGKRIVIALNKADMAAQDIFKQKPEEQQRLAGRFMKRFVFLQRLPVMFISAETGQGVTELLDFVSQEIEKPIKYEKKPKTEPKKNYKKKK